MTLNELEVEQINFNAVEVVKVEQITLNKINDEQVNLMNHYHPQPPLHSDFFNKIIFLQLYPNK